MSSDIEDLLVSAADDSAEPMRHTVDDVVRRGRRGQRLRRISAVAVSAIAVAGVATAVAVLPGQDDEAPVAGLGLPESTVTVDVKTGEVAQPAKKNALSDAQVLARCQTPDAQYRQSGAKAGGGSESIAGWKVALTQGAGSWFQAILVSPDRRRYAYCLDNAGAGAPNDDYLRQSVTADKPYVVWADHNGSKGVVPRGVAKINFLTSDGVASPAVIKDGFFLWSSPRTAAGDPSAPIWAIFSDAQGRELARFNANPFQNDQTGVPGGKTTQRSPIFPKR